MRMLIAAIVAFVTIGHAQAPAVRPSVPGAPAGVTAFVDVDVLPMDKERILRRQTVLVEGGRVTALGPTKQIKVPTGATRIDGRGRYLMPGLADAHTHLAFSARDSVVSPEVWERRLFFFVANGVTTIRNMDHMRTYPVGLQVRAWAAEGTILSPRLYIGGSGQWPHMASAFAPDKLAKVRLDSIASAVAAFQATGHDFIKVYHEQGTVYDSVLAAAHRLGIPVMGHVPYRTGMLQQVLQAGQASIEHLTGYVEVLRKGLVLSDAKNEEEKLRNQPELAAAQKQRSIHPDSLVAQRQQIDFAAIPALVKATKQAGTWNCPTQALFEMMSVEWRQDSISGWPEVEYIAPSERAAWLKGARAKTVGKNWRAEDNYLPLSEVNGTLEARRRLIKALQDADAGLLLGTDYPVMMKSWVPGVAVHRELQALVRAGLTPYQALATGTRNIAQFFGTLDETGTVAVGKRADLVLLRGNPLENIQNTMQPAGVMVGGRWLARAEIDRRLAAIWAADSAAKSP